MMARKVLRKIKVAPAERLVHVEIGKTAGILYVPLSVASELGFFHFARYFGHYSNASLKEGAPSVIVLGDEHFEVYDTRSGSGCKLEIKTIIVDAELSVVRIGPDLRKLKFRSVVRLGVQQTEKERITLLIG